MFALNISEAYTSIQGEGIQSGRPSIIIRFSGCNQKCKWCDTPIRSPNTDITLGTLRTLFNDNPHHDIIFTGGEPLLYQQEISKISSMIHPDTNVTIETNGSISPTPSLKPDLWSVSPKLHSSGEKCRLPIIREFNSKSNTQFKFVIDANDYRDLSGFRGLCDMIDNYIPIVVQPVAASYNDNDFYLENYRYLIETILDMKLSNNIRILPQLHKLAWGFSKEGV